MDFSPRSICITVLLLGMIGLISGRTHAQSIYDAPARSGDHVTVQWSKPSLEGDGFTFITSSLFLSGQFEVADDVRLVGEIPVGVAQYDDTLPADEQSASVDIGNPYLGIEYAGGESYMLEAGVRLPVLSSDALNPFRNASGARVGLLTQQNRLFAFSPDFITLHALNNVIVEPDNSSLEFQFRAGPVAAISTDNDEFSGMDSELLSNLGLSAWLTEEKVELGVGLTNWYVLSEEGDAASRSYTDVGLSIFGRFDSIEPGLSLRAPLDDQASEISPFSVSVMVRVPID